VFPGKRRRFFMFSLSLEIEKTGRDGNITSQSFFGKEEV